MKLSPFVVTKSFRLRISFDKEKLLNTSTWERISHQKALDISRNMQTTYEFI